MPRRKYARLIDGNRLCRCGTGRYCHAHQIYDRTPTAAELEECHRLPTVGRIHTVPCRGGVRVNRKHHK